MNTGDTVQGPCRELHWHERNTDQKVEKMAEAIESLTYKLREALDLLDQLSQHSHCGELIAVPMRHPRHAYPEGLGASYWLKNPLGKERL